MSSSRDQEDNRKNCIKRQSANSPLAVMSPSVRPQSTKLFRLSKTPLRPKLANINRVDPNIDATFLELCSVETDEVPAITNSDHNIEQSLVEETLQSEEAMKEALPERSTASKCSDAANITDIVSSSITATSSPGMSDEMKSAIKAYLESTSVNLTSLLESKTELLNTVSDAAEDEKSEDIDEMNISVSVCGSQERATENNSTDSVKTNLSAEFSAETIEVNSCSEIVCEAMKMNDAIETPFIEKIPDYPIIQFKNAEVLNSNTSKCPAAQVGERVTSPDMPKNLTLSVRKNKVFATRNLNLDNLSSPRELANYAQERAQNYSFLINEAYCETSVFCENCYAMRIELGLFSEKFATLTATIGDTAAEKNRAFVAELENLLKRKQAEIVTLSSKLRDLIQTNEQLSKQKKIAEKDAEDYRFILKDEMKKKLEEIDILRRKLYEAEDLIDELTQAKPKDLFEKNTVQTGVEFDSSLVEECQMEVQIEIMRQQLDTAHSLHQKAQQRIEELECKLQKIKEEKDQLSLKLQETLIDFEKEESNRIMSAESEHVSIISLLETKVAELGNKIDEVLRAKEDETVKQKSFLVETLTSLLEKIRSDVKNKIFVSEWEIDDVEISLIYFEKAVNIICQDIPQFETLVETVAQHGKLARNGFKQLKAMMEEMLEEKKKWEMVFENEKLKLDSLQEVMLAQFCENRNFFSSLLQKLDEKWSKDSSELRCTTCLKEQRFLVTSFQAETQEMSRKIEMLHEFAEKDFKISSTLMDSLQDSEANQKNRMDSVKNQLEHYEREKDVFKETHGEEDLKRTTEYLQEVERSQSTVLCKNLDFGRENFARIIDIAENLAKGKDKLENENATLRSTISRLEKENTDLKVMEKAWSSQDKKSEEIEHTLSLLQKENERLEKACDDADGEVEDLKEQIFELLRTNAKLQAVMHGENEEAVNIRMGYIEAPVVWPRFHSSAQGTALEINSPNIKPVNTAESLFKSKLDMNVEDVLIEKAEVEKRNEMQKLEEEDNVLAKTAKVLTKKLLFEESPKSQTIRDRSCRTS